MSRRSRATGAKALAEALAKAPPLSAQRPCDVQVGQLSLWWRPEVADGQRAQILAKMRAIKPHRRCPRIRHGAARAAWERRGAACLDAPDTTELTDRNRGSHRHVVRVYYRSMGEELLCFEVHDLTDREATSLRDSLPRTAYADHWSTTDDEDEIPAIRHGARLVVLPSQRANPVQVIEVDGVATYPAEIREMESMLTRNGYGAHHAARLNAEGMGPEELRVYLSIPSGVGSLEYTHGIQPEPTTAAPEPFTYARCTALRGLLSRAISSDRDRELHAACNSVLYGSDAERARAQSLLMNSAPRIAELEAPLGSQVGA